MYVNFEDDVEFNVENVSNRVMKCGDFKERRCFWILWILELASLDCWVHKKAMGTFKAYSDVYHK
jgi:hypothetical protein